MMYLTWLLNAWGSGHIRFFFTILQYESFQSICSKSYRISLFETNFSFIIILWKIKFFSGGGFICKCICYAQKLNSDSDRLKGSQPVLGVLIRSQRVLNLFKRSLCVVGLSMQPKRVLRISNFPQRATLLRLQHDLDYLKFREPNVYLFIDNTERSDNFGQSNYMFNM